MPKSRKEISYMKQNNMTNEHHTKLLSDSKMKLHAFDMTFNIQLNRIDKLCACLIYSSIYGSLSGDDYIDDYTD